jgi:hypothetical protein
MSFTMNGVHSSKVAVLAIVSLRLASIGDHPRSVINSIPGPGDEVSWKNGGIKRTMSDWLEFKRMAKETLR